MKNLTWLAFLLLWAGNTFAQQTFSKQEFSINGFRNPSIGAEFRLNRISIHGGYYLSNFESGVTTKFLKSGLSYWFLPVGKGENPSSFYVSISYARGLNGDYKNQNAGIAETGFRWMVYKGLNLRLGVAVLAAEGKGTQINPTPGISYSFFSRKKS